MQADLIDLDHPNYQFVAARLLMFSLRKSLYGRMREVPDLYNHITQCVGNGLYDGQVLIKYSQEELEKLMDM